MRCRPTASAEARTRGFDDYWTKPIDLDRFLAGIDALSLRLGGDHA